MFATFFCTTFDLAVCKQACKTLKTCLVLHPSEQHAAVRGSKHNLQTQIKLEMCFCEQKC